MKEKLYIKLKDGEIFKTSPMYTGNNEVLVDFDDKWNVLGLSIVSYLEFKKLSETEFLKTV